MILESPANLTYYPDQLSYGGASVGIPGTLALMDMALKKYGTWTLERCLQPAIKLAREGYKLSKEKVECLIYLFIAPYAAEWIEIQAGKLRLYNDSAKLFLDNGKPKPEGINSL